MALAFADAGADVAVNYVANEPSAKQLVQSIEGKGQRALAFEATVGQQNAEVAQMFGKSNTRLGRG